MLTYVLNELQWLNIYASGKLSDRLTAITSERLTLTYQRIFIIEKIPKLFSNIKNTTIAIHLDLYSNFSIQMFIWLSPRKCFRVRGCIRREIRARSGFRVKSRVGLGLGISLWICEEKNKCTMPVLSFRISLFIFVFHIFFILISFLIFLCIYDVQFLLWIERWKKIYYEFDEILYRCLWIGDNYSMGPENSACKSDLAVKSGVVKSGKINIAKAYKNLGPRYPGC